MPKSIPNTYANSRQDIYKIRKYKTCEKEKKDQKHFYAYTDEVY